MPNSITFKPLSEAEAQRLRDELATAKATIIRLEKELKIATCEHPLEFVKQERIRYCNQNDQNPIECVCNRCGKAWTEWD